MSRYTFSEAELLAALRKAVHELKLCKDDGVWHRIAHPDDDDEDAEGSILISFMINALTYPKPAEDFDEPVWIYDERK
jgi:hypothetical protein